MTKALEPRWLTAARQYIGLREIAGRQHNPQILRWWTLIRAGFTDDETPWCAGFVGGILESCGIRSSRSAAARSYLNYGTRLAKPVVGCIVVFERGAKNGHVGFVVGLDARGNLLVLGGNQGDAVNIKPFPVSRVLGYRWPAGEPLPARDDLPKVQSTAPISRRESLLSEALEDGPAPTTWRGKIKHWLNVGATSGGAFLTALLSGDWRAIAVVVAAGVVVFAIIWFTHMRRR